MYFLISSRIFSSRLIFKNQVELEDQHRLALEELTESQALLGEANRISDQIMQLAEGRYGVVTYIFNERTLMTEMGEQKAEGIASSIKNEVCVD